MVALCLVALASTFDFSGNRLPELAAEILRDRKQSAAFLVSRSQLVRRVKFGWSTPEEFNAHLAGYLNLRSDSTETAYWPAAWPDNMVSPTARSYLVEPRAMNWPLDEHGSCLPRVEQGVYCRLGDLNDLADMGGLPIRVHWFLENAVVAFAGTGSLYDSIPAIARAVGGVVTRSDDSVTITPDPSAYRSRMIQALQRREAVETQEANAIPPIFADEDERLAHYDNCRYHRYEALEIRSGIAALEQARDSEIRSAFEAEGSEKELLVKVEPGTKLWRALDRQMELYFLRYRGFDEESISYARERLRSIDTSKPIHVVVKLRHGEADVRFSTINSPDPIDDDGR